MMKETLSLTRDYVLKLKSLKPIVPVEGQKSVVYFSR
jgi:hypothetical protein